MIRAALFALTLAAPTLLPAPAQAKDGPAPWAPPYAGTWTLAPSSEGGYACTLKFGTAMAIGGAEVQVSPACRKNYPLEDAAAWSLSPANDILLIDPLRKVLIKFRKGPGGDYMGQIKGRDSMVLSRGDLTTKASARELMSGTWSLSGPDNGASCGFTVTSDKSGASGSLKRAGRCAAAWEAKAWARWSVKGDQITLADKAGKALLKLKRGDRTTFMREDKSGPVFFGPGQVTP